MKSDFNRVIRQLSPAVSSKAVGTGRDQRLRMVGPVTYSKDSFIVHVKRAMRKLERVISIDDLKNIRDEAEDMSTYAASAKCSLAVRNECEELNLTIERKIGELLTEAEIRQNTVSDKRRTHGIELPGTSFLLKRFEITASQASQYRMLSSLTEYQFEKHIRKIKDDGESLTIAGMLKYAKEIQRHNPGRRGPDVPKKRRNPVVHPPTKTEWLIQRLYRHRNG